jgi:hypothetical protein
LRGDRVQRPGLRDQPVPEQPEDEVGEQRALRLRDLRGEQLLQDRAPRRQERAEARRELRVALGLRGQRLQQRGRAGLVGALERRGRERAQALFERAVARRRGRGGRRAPRDQRLQDDVGLRRPPAVDRLPADTRGARNRPDGQRGIAVLAQQALRGVEDRLARLLVALGAGVGSRGDGADASRDSESRLGAIVETP